MEQLPTPMRRKRVFFSEEETQNLLHGVEMFGKSWSLILQNFKFHTTSILISDVIPLDKEENQSE
jgi:hypothetical protein